MSTGRSAPANAPAIRMAGVVKTFGAVVANRDAALEVQQGEIHALVGENGAGKSTLMRVLAGLYAPDGGTVEVNGRDVTGWKTTNAIAAGVGMVHQHFMLVPTLTVAENVVLGMEPTKGITIDLQRAVLEVEALCKKCGLHVDARATIADLTVGEAQRVEILKALYRGARVLILDEPTAVLSPPEVQELWGVLRTLRADGG
ncbi:ATP-binding cassette domain-containing protein, partial [Gemmatimonas sp.]|uniref:ATP-binding cassette domain-containing protein n=1 Tax=Gemmatimonas sp. TaxID=1962908 RepID=UPI0037BF68A3